MYLKLDDINFKDTSSKELAKRLYKDIQLVESQLMENEELLESLKKSLGEKQANFLIGILILRDKKILAGLKISFYYYTGMLPDKILSDVDTEETVDIFNPI